MKNQLKYLVKRQLKSMVMIGLMSSLLISTMALQIISKDEAVSLWERRPLAAFPEISAEKLLDARWMTELEIYLADAFPFRDGFRSIKSVVNTKLFGKLDSNGYYTAEGHLSKLDYTLDEIQIALGAKKLNTLYEKYLEGMNVFYAVIPDKNYYLAEQNGYPSMDYERLTAILEEKILHMAPINLFDCLKIEDYYVTDPHWKQERLDRVIGRLSETMGFETIPFHDYEKNTWSEFYGAYSGQSALTNPSDALVYLTSPKILETQVHYIDNNQWTGLYTPDADLKMDGYAYYLGGAVALQVVLNPNGETGRELILFRDSFASSLTPLLMEAYDKVTLVDLRYMPSERLGEYIDFGDQDVLFLYSTLVLNQSAMLR